MKRTLLQALREEKDTNLHGGIYHKLQVELTYNSNHIEGNTLTKEQTRYIFETNTIEADKSIVVDDLVETANHFKCVDLVIDNIESALSPKFIKSLHQILKNGTADSRKSYFMVGDYKKLPNEVGGHETTPPKEVPAAIKNLLDEYNYSKNSHKTFEDIINFHYRFESIHPFQDGNGRIGRLIALKECLKNNLIPFVIDENLKLFYYRGLSEYEKQPGYLLDTCRSGQDKIKKYLDYFEIKY